MRNRISPFVWLDNQAEEAAQFYAATFPDARLLGRSPPVVSVEVGGLEFLLFGGGLQSRINPSISFFYNCGSEPEIDTLWKGLSDGGSVLMPLEAYPFARRYGWIADRYGVNWQLILPSAPPRQKAFPSLMFTQGRCGRAEEAVRFYTSVFKDSSVGTLSRYGAGQAPDREGTLNYGEFSLAGQWFSVMDSAYDHKFTFSVGVSLHAACETREDVDSLRSRLSEDGRLGGSAVPAGSEGRGDWLEDRFGVSWQVGLRVQES